MFYIESWGKLRAILFLVKPEIVSAVSEKLTKKKPIQIVNKIATMRLNYLDKSSEDSVESILKTFLNTYSTRLQR